MTVHFAQRAKDRDDEFVEYTIDRVTKYDDDYEVIADGGVGFLVPDRGIEPHVGDIVRYYGRGFGSIVRGVDINGHTVFYRTPRQQALLNKRQLAASERRDKLRFEKNRAQYDSAYNDLPIVFRRRIDGFRERNPDFRWQHEGYEVFVCAEAVKIAGPFWGIPNPGDLIRDFSQQSWEKQKELVPTLSEGHSGNTFGAACHLAVRYLRDEEDGVVFSHGALCPIVGCASYGCWSTTQRKKEGVEA